VSSQSEAAIVKDAVCFIAFSQIGLREPTLRALLQPTWGEWRAIERCLQPSDPPPPATFFFYFFYGCVVFSFDYLPVIFRFLDFQSDISIFIFSITHGDQETFSKTIF
jgi:hypothetical protein